MLGIDNVLASIFRIEYIRGEVISRHIITFIDGSKLELASDRIYRYPLNRTDGIAKLVGVLELQYIDLNYLRDMKQA